ncbi:MAG: SDR family oxidoreductase [Candidatus Wallbacteria bacterium]
MQNLTGKIVLVTGASSGIGEACAYKFAESGANLIITSRNIGKIESVKNDLNSKYPKIKVLACQLDVRDKAGVRSFFETLPTEFKNIDILVNNAGLAHGLDKLQDGKIEDWEDMIDTNVKGLLYCTKYVLKIMTERNSGHIINIGSIAGHEVYPGGAVYCATKHSVNAISRALRCDLLGYEVKVTSIDPGMVETGFSVVRFNGDAERAKKVYENMTPLTADDIADSVFYAATRPKHVNINEIILMPVAQASAGLVHRNNGNKAV